jgi:hypothetical protein
MDHRAHRNQETTRVSTNIFVVDRKNLRQYGWLTREPAPLAEGEIRMRIDCFALTSNNITYGAFGDAMNYWAFFPTGEAESGCIPVWGFAEVAESRAEGVTVGERFYGYYPMADEVVLQPTRIGPAGFIDGAAHRRELHVLYNQYGRCDADPTYDAGLEAQQALLRPLFMTSFLIDDFLADNGFFPAGSAANAVLRAGTGQEARRRLGRRRVATENSSCVAGVHEAGERPATALDAGRATQWQGRRRTHLRGAPGRAGPATGRALPVDMSEPPLKSAIRRSITENDHSHWGSP